jgi:hypothetical protein
VDYCGVNDLLSARVYMAQPGVNRAESIADQNNPIGSR